MKLRGATWAGVFGGAASWYAAHDLSTYLSPANCAHPWVVPLIHAVALLLAAASGLVSWRACAAPAATQSERRIDFSALIGTGAAALFALVILLQGVASLFLTGCER